MRRIIFTSLNLSYFFVQVDPLPLLMGLPCPRSEENYARRGIAVEAAVAAATATLSSRLSLLGLIGKLLPKLMINAYVCALQFGWGQSDIV